MKESEPDLPFDKLTRCIHEPARLAVLSLLINSGKGMSYADLREQLNLTYGNLERHMKVLLENEIVTVDKVKASGRAQSIARFSDSGRESFLQYLDNLEKILLAAQGKQKQEKSGMEELGGNEGMLGLGASS